MAFGKTLKLEETEDGFDLVYNGVHQLEIVEDTDKITQDIAVLLKTQVGEDIFNLAFGSNFDLVVRSNTPDLVIETVIIEALRQYRYYSGLSKIKVIERDYVNRTIKLELFIKINEENVRVQLVV